MYEVCAVCENLFDYIPKSSYVRKCCSLSCAAKIAAQKSVERRKSLIDIERARALYESGLTLKQVASVLGKSKAGIRKQLHKHGIKWREPNDYKIRTKDKDEIIELYQTFKLST